MNYLYSNILLLLTISLILVAIIGRWIARRVYNNFLLIDLVYYFIFIKLILYYLIPTILRIYSGYQFEVEDGISINRILEIYFIENISWVFWSMGFLGVLCVLRNNNNPLKIDNLSKQIILIISYGYIFSQIIYIYGINQPIILEPFKTLFYFYGLTIGPFLIVISRKYLNNFYLTTGVLVTVISLITTSTRGVIVYILLFIIFLSWSLFESKKYFYRIIILFSIIVFMYFSFGGLLKPEISIDNGDIAFNVNIDVGKKGGRSSLDEVEWRFGAATRMGTAFIDLYDSGKSAGFNPILHSIQGILPRSLMPDKPFPSTLDGDDIYSQGMYIIYREIHGYDNVSMVEFPTGAHFYWEFGYLGIIFLSILSGIYIAIFSHQYAKLGLISIPLIIVLFKPWGYMDPKIWISDAVMQIYQIALPVILMIFILRSFDTLKKYFRLLKL